MFFAPCPEDEFELLEEMAQFLKEEACIPLALQGRRFSQPFLYERCLSYRMSIPPTLADLSEALLLHQEYSSHGVNRLALEDFFSLPPLPFSIQKEQQLLLEILQLQRPEEDFSHQLRGASLWMESLFENVKHHLSTLFLVEPPPLVFLHRVHLRRNTLFGEGVHRASHSFYCFEDGLKWKGDQKSGFFSFSFPLETLPYDAKHTLSFLRGIDNPIPVPFPIPEGILPIAFDENLLMPQILAYLREKISHIL